MIIAVSSNSSWNLFNFRKNLLQKLDQVHKCHFYILCPEDAYLKDLELKNVIFKRINLKPRKISILNDLILISQYFHFLFISEA